MNIFFDLYQQGAINEAKNQAESARDTAGRTRSEVDDLKRKADALTIACQALWEIVREQMGLSDEAIIRKMQEIDLRDGTPDGKITATIAECPSCRRTNNAARRNCLYCGGLLPLQHVFSRS